MADSVVKLKVESQEYDSKIARAAEGLQRLASKIHDSQGEFQGLDKDTKVFIQNLQYMNTVSQTSAGKVRELENAYKGLQTMYNGFTGFEKNSEEGRLLAEQLEKLKQRTQQARQEMADANKSLNDTGGVLGQLASKFTINIDAMKLFDVGLKAVNAALDVAKDAFFASEATVDEWGRIMDSSKSLYEGFLTALNTGDISGYLGRIDEIVQAARAAYNELDRLGTMKTIQAPKMSAQQTENERMRMMIQTGRYIAPIDGRKASMKDGQLLTPEQIKRIEQQLQNGMKTVVNLVGNEVKQTSKTIDAVYNRQAKELGLSLSEFKKGTSSMAEFDKRMDRYDKYQKWREQHTTIDLQSGRETVARGNPYQEYAKWGTFRVDGQRYNDLVRLIQQRDQQSGQAYSMQSQAYRTMNRAEGVTLRSIMGGGSGGKGGKGGTTTIVDKDDFQEMEELTGLINIQKQKLEDLQAMKPFAQTEEEIISLNEKIAEANDEFQRLQNLGNEPIEDPFTPALSPLQELQQQLKELREELELAPNTEAYQAGLQAIADKEKEIAKFKGQTNTSKIAKDSAKSWQSAASAIQSVGSAMSQIEDPAAKVMGTIAQAIAGIAMGFGQAAKGPYSSPWEYIAFIASGMASMITAIASIHSATGYANGGVVKAANGAAIPGAFTVPGTTFSGDQVPAMLNAGEVVLNRAQQGNLASQLEGSGMQNLRLSATVTGEQIRLALNNNGRRTGRGEMVTWK